MDETERTIVELLRSTERDGMGALVDELLIKKGFFTSPASTKYHGACPGGLAQHSLNVFNTLKEYAAKFKRSAGPGSIQLPVTRENIIIAALLHDVCKAGAYLGESAPYRWNRATPKGHALLSLIYISKYIELTQIEEMMIKFHMGTYGTLEFGSYCSEFPIRGDKSKSKEERYGQSLANAWYHNPIVKLMYFCDELDNFATV